MKLNEGGTMGSAFSIKTETQGTDSAGKALV